ncbi:MAG: hypothetical protein QME55_11285, partial [Brevundimonas sp.]|nr:hypothetical protein [Brevundimonas sp.]
MRLAAVILGAALAVAPAAFAQTEPAPPPAFDSAGWVADLEQVRQAMSAGYANLEWAVTEREAPLGPLFAVGRQRLEAARSEAEAREVFERLERYLGDKHVDFVWPRAGGPGAPGGTSDRADERPPCERLGFKADGR